ncbi:LOW QUALITY PROTEIN: probable methyltransferase TARBP1 [Liolophura sinensis]|uniref:LOW QUALITY PROTEIN: probable methyltransferase TARBP1 n=1 Tax=Liolophura sinensis TaxID=3198878 RepID=UPI0031588A7C
MNLKMNSSQDVLRLVLKASSLDYGSLIPSLLETLVKEVQEIRADLAVGSLLPDLCCSLEAFQQVFLSYTSCAREDCSHSQGQKSKITNCNQEEYVLQCVKNVVLPLLQKLHFLHNYKEDKAVSLLIPSCDLLATCIKFADLPTKFLIWNFCLDSLLRHSCSAESGIDNTAVGNTASVKSEGVVDLHSLIEIMRCLLQEYNKLKNPADLHVIFPDDTWSEKIFQEIIKLIAKRNDKVVTKVVSLVVVKLLRCDPEKLPHRLEILWKTVCEDFHKSMALPSSGVGGSSSVSEKPYIVLCGLADFYFPVGQFCGNLHKHMNLVNNTEFWTIIQSGLVQKNPVTRKRSLYLLKRIIDICENESETIIPAENSLENSSENSSDKEHVACATAISSGTGSGVMFRWDPELKIQLSKVWENFILLIETLNEKQLHVVRPLFPRLNHLIDACSKSDSLGSQLLHSSWVVTVVRRALIHESVYVVMWGVKALLRSDPQKFPLLHQGQDEFISGEFLIALKETRLYCREPKEPMGSQPEIGHLVCEFLLKCWKTLESHKRAEFFRGILLKIRGDNWGQFPLVYLWQGLAGLPVSSLWNKESVLAIREIMSTSLTTVEQFNRGAIQCFLVESLVNLMDLELVTPADFSVVLAACSNEESLQRGTTLWKTVASRLNLIAVDNKSPENWTKAGLEVWIQTSIIHYLKAEEKSASGYQLQLSRILLLFVDGCGHCESEVTGQNAVLPFLNSCLSPVTDVLSRLINHAYLSIEKGDRAVELLMSLLEGAISESVSPDDPVVKLLLVTTGQFLEEIVHQIIRGKDQVTCTENLSPVYSYLHVLKILGHRMCVIILVDTVTKQDQMCLEADQEYAKELMIQGEERKGVANVLVAQLCEVFSGDRTLAAAADFCNIVAEACVFGSLPQRIDKTWFETCAYIDSLGDNCTVNTLFPYLGHPDAMVRVTIINFLTKLQPTSEDHSCFVAQLIHALMRKHEDVNRMKAAWNFVNSLQHRVRHRVSQALLLLEPFIQMKDLTNMVWGYIWSVLAQETQPSVRNLLEWLALRLLVRHHHLHPRLWSLFDNTPVTEQRHLSICSLLFVVAHLGCHLPTHLQESFYSKAIVVVFPWCTVHHFNTRIHAQVCLKKLWHQCQEFELQPLIERFPMIQACLNFSKDESNSTKNAEKLEAHYIFSTFDVQGDYSIETIYETFPRLACLSDEEWISPSSFLRSDNTWQEQTSHYLPLFNSNDRLKSFTPGPGATNRSVDSVEQSFQLSSKQCLLYMRDLQYADMYENHTEVDGQDGDVQKKILPWRFMKPDAEAEEQLELRRVKERGQGLILVTSLIEKIPNLGGLCRTSEIFGVSEFVIGNLQNVNDRAFQSLSVTAHKWLPVTEVKLFQLKDYLLSKRRHGYTLVGVEQTANSVSLTDYQFPQKTLLLLGNEKEGIPANLIQFLDTCVEIPQQGVIRSLNVHVSGALFVWEYTRQQLSKSASQP